MDLLEMQQGSFKIFETPKDLDWSRKITLYMNDSLLTFSYINLILRPCFAIVILQEEALLWIKLEH